MSFFPSASASKSEKTRARSGKNKELHSLEDDPFWVHLRNLKMYKSTGLVYEGTLTKHHI